MTFEQYLIIAVAAVPAIVCTIVAIASIIDDFNHNHLGE
tara:strand:+ start:519 stop:635 length:117 start_codon:yes stop_codon:yes gene_type:complete